MISHTVHSHIFVLTAMITLGIVRGVHVSVWKVSDLLVIFTWIGATFCCFLQILSERWQLFALHAGSQPQWRLGACSHLLRPCSPQSRLGRVLAVLPALNAGSRSVIQTYQLSEDCWEFFFIVAQGCDIINKMWIKVKGSENVFAPAASHKQQINRTCTKWTITASRLFSNSAWSFDFKCFEHSNQFCRGANPLTDQERRKPKWYCSH